MKIGTLVFYVYCELVGKQSIENLQSFIHQNLISVSDKFVEVHRVYLETRGLPGTFGEQRARRTQESTR